MTANGQNQMGLDVLAAFDIDPAAFGDTPGQRVLNMRMGKARGAKTGREPAAVWLSRASRALFALAAGAAAVSVYAQYRFVDAYKHTTWIAGVQSVLPDAGAVVFAALGIAMALHGKRALRERALNLACVATSVATQVMAAGPGWRSVAVWVMPSLIYAVASDTYIAVVRAQAIASQNKLPGRLDALDSTPLVFLAARGLLWVLRIPLYPLRLIVDYHGTVTGLRILILLACPMPTAPAGDPEPERKREHHRPADAGGRHRGGTKTARLFAAVERDHGGPGCYASLDPGAVNFIATQLATEVGMNANSAANALRTKVRLAIAASQNGHQA